MRKKQKLRQKLAEMIRNRKTKKKKNVTELDIELGLRNYRQDRTEELEYRQKKKNRPIKRCVEVKSCELIHLFYP